MWLCSSLPDNRHHSFASFLGHRRTNVSLVRSCANLQVTGDLRATPASTVLHGFGHLLSQSKGSGETHKQSEPVANIDCFISHNWSVDRFRKFLALSMHFYHIRAMVCTWIVVVVAAALTVCGVLPSRNTSGGKCGIACWLTSAPVFFSTLFLSHEIDYFLGRRTLPVFLDKTCIHQTDLEKKKKGIEQLGGVISKSSDMVVCYSALYLRKLWTVYELACFLLVKGRPVIVVHIAFPLMCIIVVLTFYAYVPISRYILTRSNEQSGRLMEVASAVGCRALTLYVNRLQNDMRHSLETFALKDASCSTEGDRKFVYSNIVTMIKKIKKKWAESVASDDKGLEEFDRIVREEVPNFLIDSMGRVGVSWRYIVMIVGTTHLPNSLDLWAAQVWDANFRGAVLRLAHVVFKTLTLLPNWYALDYFVVKTCLAQEPIKKFMGLAISLPFAWAILHWYTIINRELARRGATSDVDAAFFVALHVSLAVVAICVYAPWPWQKTHRQKQPPESDAIELHDWSVD